MPSYRARFDATVAFTNGGGLQVQGFLVDVPSAEVTPAEIGELFLDSLGLLMAGDVGLTNVEVIEAAHKGTRGGPATTGEQSGAGTTYVELSHSDDMSRTVDLPAVVVRVQDSWRLGIDAAALATYEVRGKAVLLHTGDGAHFLTRDGAEWLIDRGAVLVGIDAATIDDVSDGETPAHTLLRGAGVVVVEDLTNLGEVPPLGALFTAVAPGEEGTVRAWAKVSG
ncbi:cyclase family protein [Kribbella sp. NBC_01505]|uniref:cyclase family protein n=1 Tax=Kribbella sp. NBC_01505 TaxID=2903580 RepID=UPI0038641931